MITLYDDDDDEVVVVGAGFLVLATSGTACRRPLVDVVDDDLLSARPLLPLLLTLHDDPGRETGR